MATSTAPQIALGPAPVDITGVRANDRNLITGRLTYKGDPVNLTGSTLTSQARKRAQDADPPALVAVCEITVPLNGEYTIRWPGDAVATLLGTAASWSGVWDFQLDDGSPDGPITIAAGAFGAVWDVTR